ncbi:MAG: hypothetical protein K0S93_1429 [Nitrososphaeraceae archaeon]|jgi:hypothetical protein|nr:hypothetical protein [Nitrososphaeraceae archaeon]
MMVVFYNSNIKYHINKHNFCFKLKNLLNGFPILSIFLLLSLLYVNNDRAVLVEASELSVFLPNEKPFGLTYGEWSAEWWKWLLSSPSDSNPSTDKTGQYCTMNQNNSNVWFLAGTSGGYEERKCSIQEGKAILVSPIEVICTFADYPELKTEDDLRNCAKSDQDAVKDVKLIVDSIPMMDLQNYRVASSLFNVTLPENNIFGVPPQTTEAISDGTFVMLKELPVGHHTIYASGLLVDFTTTSNLNFVSEVKYDISVIPRQ